METASDLGLMTPSTRPSPIRILSALERQPGAWIRTGPQSIEHAGLRVRLTLGIVSVRIAHVIPDADPVPIQAEPATRDRIAELLEDRLRRGTGVTWIPTALRGAPARRRRPGKGRRGARLASPPGYQPSQPGPTRVLQGGTQTVHLLPVFFGFRMPLLMKSVDPGGHVARMLPLCLQFASKPIGG